MASDAVLHTELDMLSEADDVFLKQKNLRRPFLNMATAENILSYRYTDT